jgi:hypothetical protein
MFKTTIVLVSGLGTAALASGSWYLIALACFGAAALPGWFLALSVSSVAMATAKAVLQANELVNKL